MKRNEIYAVEEVLTEGALTHHLLQVTVCGTHHTYIHIARLAVAENLESAVLQHTQQLHLTGEVKLSDLIKEYGTAIGHCKASYPVGRGIGEGTAFVSEHLTFEERL